MEVYMDHLAACLIQNASPITYELLSRQLKVHVQLAKQMLYHFHATENQKKPGSIHATYLITGTKRPQPASKLNDHIDRDANACSRSPSGSSVDIQVVNGQSNVKVTSMVLVKEEHFADTKAQFEEISSIHVYSLAPESLKDLAVLSDCRREMTKKYSAEEPLKAWETYGTICNPHAWRREPAMKPQTPLPIATTAPQLTDTNMPKQKETTRNGPGQQHSLHSTTAKTSANRATNGKSSKAQRKKEAASIFASFAKTQPKKAPVCARPATLHTTEKGRVDDESMMDTTDAEDEKMAAAEHNLLMDMMEEDDDNSEVQNPVSVEDEKSDIAEPAVTEPGPGKEEVTVSNGRRRGRRRVMQKKTYKDEHGYFVTKEEPVWEPFSEDDVLPNKKSTRPAPVPAPKAKKRSVMQGQGSIRTFFGKKSS